MDRTDIDADAVSGLSSHAMGAGMRRWMLIGALLLASACGDKDCDPDATEICNNQDDNCDGEIDEGLETLAFYADSDSDGYGTSFSSVVACAQPPGYAAAGTDCDDTDASISPDAEEVCDGADNDCDGAVDAKDGTLSDGVIGYLDADEDGFGGAPAFSFCELPSGFIDVGGDCDDFDVAVTTGRIWYTDGDGDGYGDPNSILESCEVPGDGYVSEAGDCDDAEAAISPGEAEVCDDGMDNNCDGTAGDCTPLSGDLSTTDADATLTGSSSYFGRWLSSADVDGSGRRALVTSDVGESSGVGAIYVFEQLSEGESLDTGDAATIVGPSTSETLGYSTIALDDLTGDGISDVVAMSDSGQIAVFDSALSGRQVTDDAAVFIDGLTTT
ncbi:MAG: hypothetical protein ACI8RZ_007674, partial [Myxococcota bacterium]